MATPASTVNASPDTEGRSGPGPRLMTANTLEGDDVVNRAGEKLGEIEEIMIDVPRGRVAYAVMSSGGFLGMGEKLFALPWSALTLDPERHCFVLDAAKARFKDAPGFDKDRWPRGPVYDDLPHQQIHQFWGLRDSWLD